MANYEINEEQEVLTKAMRMIETGDPVHADVYNALFSALLNNDVFLEKLANKMVQQAMISHVMDSTNSNMVLGADQGPVITKLIDKVQEQVTVLNTKMLFSGLKLIYKLQPGESKNIDLVNYKYIVIEGVESKVIPTGLLNVTNISTSLTRAASDSYFCYEFVFLSKNKIQYHAAYCMGFNERTISIYGIE